MKKKISIHRVFYSRPSIVRITAGNSHYYYVILSNYLFLLLQPTVYLVFDHPLPPSFLQRVSCTQKRTVYLVLGHLERVALQGDGRRPPLVVEGPDCHQKVHAAAQAPQGQDRPGGRHVVDHLFRRLVDQL